MKLKSIILTSLTVIGIVFSNFIKAQDIALADFDKKGVEVVNKFIEAINANPSDIQAAALAAMPFIHRSDYDAAGTNLKKDRLDFSFKKAWQNAKFYDFPIKVTRVQKQSLTAIGFGATAQAGTSYKVFIGKKAGVSGMPAPMHVFIPADGGDAKLHNYGSL